MIIDIHCHLGIPEMFPYKYIDLFAEHISKILPGITKEDVFKSDIMKRSFDGTPERLINEMDEAGIDKTVVFGVDWGLLLGEPKKSIEEYNKYIANAASEYSDRLIGFFTIDPRRKNAIDLFEKAISKWELKGLKLHPTTGYSINDLSTRRLIEKAIEFDIPVISHLGYIFGLKGHLASVSQFDDLTNDYPDLRLALAHLNYGSVDELLFFMFAKANVYCDFCAYGQIMLMNSPIDFYKNMRYFMNFEGIRDRIMFGSDWPMTSNIMSLKDWVKKIQDLGNDKLTNILENLGYKKFKKSEINKLLGKNAERFLGKL
ncbi:MAG: amidohydrolase family protein [Candidatus Helarchaeota archaeon]